MESSQVLRGLFENSGRQIFLARIGDVIFGSIHVVDLICSSLSQAFKRRHFRKCRKIGTPQITRMKLMDAKVLSDPPYPRKPRLFSDLAFVRANRNRTEE
jgi:hypothetical protein